MESVSGSSIGAKLLWLPSLLNLLIGSYLSYKLGEYNQFLGYIAGSSLGLFFVLAWFFIISKMKTISHESLMMIMVAFFPIKMVAFLFVGFFLHDYIGFDITLFAISFVVGLFINIIIELYALWKI